MQHTRTSGITTKTESANKIQTNYSLKNTTIQMLGHN